MIQVGRDVLCAHCGELAKVMLECTADSPTQVFRAFCGMNCIALWSANQVAASDKIISAFRRNWHARTNLCRAFESAAIHA